LQEIGSDPDRKELALRKIAETLESLELFDNKRFWRLKLDICREFSLDSVPKNSEILALIHPEKRKRLESLLRRKTIRTLSGIAVITAITKPFDCPHGTCIFCPGGVRFGTPQSYTKKSPAAAYGIAREFDPNRQVHDTIKFLSENGHDTSKVELVLLGGTILAMPKDYQENFVKCCFDALNSSDSNSLLESKKRNETSAHRCVGLTIETKPDWCRSEHVDMLLSYGTTRVEIGVQSLQENVLEFTNRGHSLVDTINSFQVSKDAGLKIVAHMMPGLPLATPERDLQDLNLLFEDERFKPDMLKIYPTLVVEGTALYQQYKMGKYTPYTLDELKEILCQFKAAVPPWVRIMRIQREIPKDEIAQGERAGNLRQIILEEMSRRNLECHCIRCREAGHRSTSYNDKIELKRINYSASGGEEVFLSLEGESTLHGFLRLRLPSGNEHRQEIRDQRTSLVRELHIYGPVVPIGESNTDPKRSQHRGLGTRLLQEAENVSKEYSRSKILVISALGTKEYYRKRGYQDEGVYVSKSLLTP
jgi:elongator complex protein 3